MYQDVRDLKFLVQRNYKICCVVYIEEKEKLKTTEKVDIIGSKRNQSEAIQLTTMKSTKDTLEKAQETEWGG